MTSVALRCSIVGCCCVGFWLLAEDSLVNQGGCQCHNVFIWCLLAIVAQLGQEFDLFDLGHAILASVFS